MLKEERHKIDKFPMTIYVPWPMTSNIECHDDMMDHHWWLVSVFRFCFSCCCCFWSRAKKERGPFWKAGHRPVRFQFNAVLARYTVPVVSVAVSSTTSRCYKTFNSDVLCIKSCKNRFENFIPQWVQYSILQLIIIYVLGKSHNAIHYSAKQGHISNLSFCNSS